MVQKDVVKVVKSGNLRVYYVWQPILPSDNLAAARGMAQKISDRRVHFFWDVKHRLGDDVGAVLNMTKGMPRSANGKWRVAWDMYLLYPPGTKWGKAPPKPTYWQHQLWGLPRHNALNGKVLRAEISKRLGKRRRP